MSFAPNPDPQVIYQQIVRPPSNGMAVTSMVLGIVAIVTGIWAPIPVIGLIAAFFAFVPGVLAVIFGVVGIRRSLAVGVGRGNSIAGIVLGGVTLAIIVLTTLAWVVAGIAASTGDYSAI